MKTNLNIKLGKRIKYLRMQRKMSQEALAEKINIATTSLSYVETGRGFMTLRTLEKLARTLNVEINELFNFSSVETNEEMFEYILKKLELIRNDDEKIRIAYNIAKTIL